MAFNPSAGYNLVSSNDEASQFMSSLRGANRRGQSAMASAALRAQNYINTAEKRAELKAMGVPQQASRSNPMEDALLGIAGNIGSVLLNGLIGGGGGSSVTEAFSGLGGFGPVANGAAYGSFLDSTAGTKGIGPFSSGDVYGSFLSRKKKT